MTQPLTGLRQKVFFDRYALKDTDGNRMEDVPQEMWHRVARAIATVEKTAEQRKQWEEKFFTALTDFKFVPGGRILTGAGAGADLTFYNCYVIPSPDDSRGGIFDSVRTMVEIMSRGGGVGVNLSSLRPRGSYVKGVNGTASGSVSFGGLYSFATGLIIQGGSRRGALMLMLNDDHPDVEEFVTVKRTMGQITNANLSVCVSDRFMEAVKRDADWELQWGGKVYKTIKAKQLWDSICESAHASGEPGVVFMERANKEANTWYFEKLVCVNPCVTGDTRVATNKGFKTIQALYESQESVGAVIDSRLSEQKTAPIARVIQTGVKDVYQLHTVEGYELTLTADHRVHTQRGWVEAQHLQQGDEIFLLNRGGAFGTVGDQQWGQVLGWFVGDGHFNVSKQAAVLSFFGEEKKELAPLFSQVVNQHIAARTMNANNSWKGNVDTHQRSYAIGVVDVPSRDEARICSKQLASLMIESGIVMEQKLSVPAPVWDGTKKMQRGFLQGLFSADGHVSGSVEKGVSVRLTSVSLSLLKEVQQLLLNFGIVSRIYENRRVQQVREMPNSAKELVPYLCQAQHDLVISKQGIREFEMHIGFVLQAKQEKLCALLANYKKRGPYKQQFTATFQSLIYRGKEMVYDLTEPLTHSFVGNGMVIHNCGEQPLPAWGVCNLGAVNIAAFVEEKILQKEALRETVRTAIRFLDNVIDVTPYFFKDNKECQMKARRVGLGTMGLGDALIKMNIRYGSDEAVAWCDEVYRLVRDESYRMSVEIAKEKGAFPEFDSEKYAMGKFIQRLPEDIQQNIATHGIRNAVLLTQAPTGTTSILSGVSSGIEPVYDFAFKRKDRLGEHIVYHPLYKEWKDAHPHVEESERPEYFVTAKELSPLEHVKMQAVVQKYTDASISKTVNAPHEHTMEQVQELYMQTYTLGCKGIAYYRDGSRDLSVLESIDTSNKKQQETKTVKQEQKEKVIEEQSSHEKSGVIPPQPRVRPEVVPGATYKIKTGYGTMYVTINHDSNGTPFEVFATIGKAGGFFAAKSEAICRLISLALRSGIAPETIVDQLRGIRGPMTAWGKNGQILSIPDAIAQVLTIHMNSAQGKLQLEFTESAAQSSLPQQQQEMLSDSSLQQATQKITVTEKVSAMQKKPFASVQSSSSIADHGFAPECPQCGSVLALAEGCMTCHSCGYSKCA
ncbi:MAG TPA: LAGLIDADG family homing endonuclease [Patescibacteria group bacterium]|nr:LAGLIDADG family homing endonuclease [Patescibacteria group bacterium]